MRMEPMLDSYNDNSALQATCQTVGNPMLASMASTYADKSKEALQVVRIAEYGCSGGRNSYAPMHTMISALRSRSPALRAECVLEDLPSNTWHQVMEEAPRLTAAFEGSVQVLCAGTSFYNQICGDASLDLAYSYVSAHFLSASMPLVSHVLMHESALGERTAWEAHAARDWENFLLLRARELKKGGKILISTMSRDSSGYSWKEFSDLIWESIQQVCSTGLLAKREAEALCIPACLRSEAEIMAPFVSRSLVGSLFAVDSLEFSRTEVEGERNLPTSVLASLVRRRVEAVWGGMFLTQLGRLGRSATSSREVMDEVWDLFEAGIAQETMRAWLDMRCFYLRLTRK
jgi:gibberellin A4 carboxyl methyltransferase